MQIACNALKLCQDLSRVGINFDAWDFVLLISEKCVSMLMLLIRNIYCETMRFAKYVYEST